MKITDEEIDQALAAMQMAQGQTEYRLSQIFLSSGSGDEASVQQSAQRLKEQLEQGADFAALASEFSQDQAAIRGGDWGWVRLDMLDPPVAQVMQTLAPGQFGGPVRGAGGYYVFVVKSTRVIDARNVAAGTVEMEQIFWTRRPMPRNPRSTRPSRRPSATTSRSCSAAPARRTWSRPSWTARIRASRPVIGFTKTVGREYASRNVTVNAVAPGFIDTAMTHGLPDDVKETLQKQIPLGRLGTPADIAAAVRFLVSDEAAYITGHVLHVNGGMLMV